MSRVAFLSWSLNHGILITKIVLQPRCDILELFQYCSYIPDGNSSLSFLDFRIQHSHSYLVDSAIKTASSAATFRDIWIYSYMNLLILLNFGGFYGYIMKLICLFDMVLGYV